MISLVGFRTARAGIYEGVYDGKDVSYEGSFSIETTSKPTWAASLQGAEEGIPYPIVATIANMASYVVMHNGANTTNKLLQDFINENCDACQFKVSDLELFRNDVKVELKQDIKTENFKLSVIKPTYKQANPSLYLDNGQPQYDIIVCSFDLACLNKTLDGKYLLRSEYSAQVSRHIRNSVQNVLKAKLENTRAADLVEAIKKCVDIVDEISITNFSLCNGDGKNPVLIAEDETKAGIDLNNVVIDERKQDDVHYSLNKW